LIRRPPRSTLSSSSAASDVYKRQALPFESWKDTLATLHIWTQMVGKVRLKPVSYTHLRAHETPEHLVCRLLLEKKKNKTNKQQIYLIYKIIKHKKNQKKNLT